MNEEKLRQRYNRQKSIDRLPPNCLQIIYDSNFFFGSKFSVYFSSFAGQINFYLFYSTFSPNFQKTFKTFLAQNKQFY